MLKKNIFHCEVMFRIFTDVLLENVFFFYILSEYIIQGKVFQIVMSQEQNVYNKQIIQVFPINKGFICILWEENKLTDVMS
jgi:hypothetical protein